MGKRRFFVMKANSTATVKSEIRIFGSTKVMVLCALLAAMSIVLGKFVNISIGDSIRISFENLPIIMASIFFGPIAGAVTGASADIVGCFLKGYSINPFITLGAVCIGFFPGLLYRSYAKGKEFTKLLTSVMSAHVVGSMIVKSIGLMAVYHTPMKVIAWRVPIYIIIGIVETIAVHTLLRNKAFKTELEKVMKK